MPLPLVINGNEIKPGSRVTAGIPLPILYTDTPVVMPVHIIRGRREGPRLFVSAAVHGDELNGVEIIRRLVRLGVLSNLRGTLITVPVVNVYGVLNRSRYLPDRRDLNRSFPGSEKGSLTARLARCFMDEVVRKCTHGIDLHTGAIHRSNLPQIRADLDDPETLKLAEAFAPPVILNATLRDGSLREAAAEEGIPMLLYEAGQALRFDEIAIRTGVRGVLNVMRHLCMLPRSRGRRSPQKPVLGGDTRWLRAPSGGMLRVLKKLGDPVTRGEPLAHVDALFGDQTAEVTAPFGGIIIGRNEIPLVHEGDALFNIARFRNPNGVAQHIETIQEQFEVREDAAADEEPPLT